MALAEHSPRGVSHVNISPVLGNSCPILLDKRGAVTVLKAFLGEGFDFQESPVN